MSEDLPTVAHTVVTEVTLRQVDLPAKAIKVEYLTTEAPHQVPIVRDNEEVTESVTTEVTLPLSLEILAFDLK